MTVRWAVRAAIGLAPALATAGCAPVVAPAPVENLLRWGAPPAALADPAFFEGGRVFDAIAGKAGSHAPAIAALPDGRLLAAWFSYDGPHELDGSAIYMAEWSPLGERPGQSPAATTGAWSAPRLHIDRPEGDGNPVLYAEGESVWLFQAVVPFGWSTAGIEYQTSSDGGQAWSEPRAIDGPIGSNVRFPPLRTDDGSLLLPAYDDLLQRGLFFVAAADDDGGGDSTSGPADWRLLAARDAGSLGAGAIQPSVARRSDGSLLAVMRSSTGRLVASIGSAAGESWSTPAGGDIPNPGSPALLMRLASGKLLLVFNNDAELRQPLSASLSDDDGRTWSPPRDLLTGPGDVAYPTGVQTADGTIHVLYSADRAFIGHVQFNEAWVLKRD